MYPPSKLEINYIEFILAIFNDLESGCRGSGGNYIPITFLALSFPISFTFTPLSKVLRQRSLLNCLNVFKWVCMYLKKKNNSVRF